MTVLTRAACLRCVWVVWPRACVWVVLCARSEGMCVHKCVYVSVCARVHVLFAGKVLSATASHMLLSNSPGGDLVVTPGRSDSLNQPKVLEKLLAQEASVIPGCRDGIWPVGPREPGPEGSASSAGPARQRCCSLVR